jgi:hypothetical protein
LIYNYIQLDTGRGPRSDAAARRGAQEAKFNRKLAILAYLSLHKELMYKPLHGVTPLRLPLDKVFLHVVYTTPVPKELILDIMNLSWVQMVRVPEPGAPLLEGQINTLPDEELSTNQCLGSGVIRSVDINEWCLYLVTPMTVDRMEQVNCLIKPNGMFIPDEMVYSQLSFLGVDSLPYVGTQCG